MPFGTCTPDYDTLGVDGNGIYIAAVWLDCVAVPRIAALPKPPLISRTASAVQDRFVFDVPNVGYSPTIQPAVNFDPIAINEPAWFVHGTDSIFYNRLVWVNGYTSAPVFQDTTWPSLSVGTSLYDLDNGLVNAPQLGSTVPVNLSRSMGNRLMMATARKIGGVQYVWTCRQIGVNQYGNNDGPQADRSAVEWIKLQTTPSVSLAASGRIRDASIGNPKFYYMPSLAVNRRGDMVIGFSGSSVNDYIGCYFSGVLNGGTSPPAPVRYFGGVDWVFPGSYIRWGDYSGTSLDPDGLTLWTIQEYAESRYQSFGQNAWGTRIGAVTPF